MAYMLGMAALEFGDPVSFLIRVEPDDPAFGNAQPPSALDGVSCGANTRSAAIQLHPTLGPSGVPMRTNRTALPAALISIFAALPLVGQSPPSNKACTLLTAADVSGVLGIKSRAGTPLAGSNVVCYFAADTVLDTSKRTVTVMIVTPEAFQFGKQMTANESPAERSVPGIGDEAYFVAMGSYAKLGVRKGTGAFSVTVTRGDGKESLAQLEALEKALGQKAAARL